MSKELNEGGGPTTFFAAFDKFVERAATAEDGRRSTMIIAVTTP